MTIQPNKNAMNTSIKSSSELTVVLFHAHHTWGVFINTFLNNPQPPADENAKDVAVVAPKRGNGSQPYLNLSASLRLLTDTLVFLRRRSDGVSYRPYQHNHRH
nr:unnamed protein product [Spirometra erinaceieuropaei]